MDKEKLIADISKLVLHQLQEKDCNTNDNLIPVGVSARHIHLCKEDLERLFGEGHELTPMKELMGGQFASRELVTIIGTKLRAIENVRVLGPIRSATQVEVSKTDAIRLGVNPPIRPSGDISGSAPLTVVGPKGAINLKEGCIVAQRHIHMTPEDAKRLGVEDNEIVKVEVLGGRGGSLSHVQVRVHESFRLEMHLDTDEANAMGIKCNDPVVIIH
ncbi:phosphate propanoyltransferase [Vallitalea okinawensis]|uniref:phosphate propanoyltransferase n=1 Tax=Vallitalea okinawensis TaxID=2078660 RepID=UPI000CFAC8FC|nr:phosphate propanoyltransferase [Vallitalea okinawensis]